MVNKGYTGMSNIYIDRKEPYHSGKPPERLSREVNVIIIHTSRTLVQLQCGSCLEENKSGRKQGEKLAISAAQN